MPSANRFGDIKRRDLRPDEPHSFYPRKHGSREACDVCGGARYDEDPSAASGEGQEVTDEFLRASAQLGTGVVMAITLWYAVLVPRKDKDGKRTRAPLLVPGWTHDRQLNEARDEAVRVRRYYEVALKDEQQRASVRVQEWRGFRDEAIASKVDAEQDRAKLLAAVSELSRDVDLLLEMARLADGRGSQPGDEGAKGH